MIPVRVIATSLLALLPLAAAGADDPAPVQAINIDKPGKVEDFAPEGEFIQVGKIKTHVIKQGEAGRPIVLIHGFGSCTYTWRRNMGPLSKSFRVYAVDIKGFGLTEKPKDGHYHLVAYTQHLLDTIETLKLDRPILVGNSMGGAIITRLALLHPDKVGGIVLVDAAPPSFMAPATTTGAIAGPIPTEKLADKPSVQPADAPSPLGERLKVVLARSLITRKRIEAGLKGAYFDVTMVTPEMVEAYYRPFTIEGAPEALLAMTNPPIVKTAKLPPLRELKPPALIIWGRYDRVIPVSTAEIFARDLPRAKKVILEKSGHLPHEEEPEKFNALVAEFAASLR